MPSGEAVLTKPEVATYSRCLAKAIPANTNEDFMRSLQW